MRTPVACCDQVPDRNIAAIGSRRNLSAVFAHCEQLLRTFSVSAVRAPVFLLSRALLSSLGNICALFNPYFSLVFFLQTLFQNTISICGIFRNLLHITRVVH